MGGETFRFYFTCRFLLTLSLALGQISPNVTGTSQVPSIEGPLSRTVQLSEFSDENDETLSLKLPCHCIDKFSNGDQWVHFSGRQSVLGIMNEAFSPSEARIVSMASPFPSTPKLKVITLYGLQGVGKTTEET